jgi:hypothetical protein
MYKQITEKHQNYNKGNCNEQIKNNANKNQKMRTKHALGMNCSIQKCV